MAIKLNIVKPTTEVEKALEAGYLYKDIQLDLTLGYTNNPELFQASEKKDLVSIQDASSVITAIQNILTTSPGEKLLNPQFGLDLRDYLFEPVNETGAFFIGRDIFDGLVTQEPRVKINKINVVANTEDQEYKIDLNISVPSLNVNNLSLKSVLNNDGYTFV
jgi:phage baseplate assembly protein W